jgi:hypothetical protein
VGGRDGDRLDRAVEDAPVAGELEVAALELGHHDIEIGPEPDRLLDAIRSADFADATFDLHLVLLVG